MKNNKSASERSGQNALYRFKEIKKAIQPFIGGHDDRQQARFEEWARGTRRTAETKILKQPTPPQ